VGDGAKRVMVMGPKSSIRVAQDVSQGAALVQIGALPCACSIRRQSIRRTIS
jgi:hypothetical protein